MKQEIKPATGRLGVLVVGVGGAVAGGAESVEEPRPRVARRGGNPGESVQRAVYDDCACWACE